MQPPTQQPTPGPDTAAEPPGRPVHPAAVAIEAAVAHASGLLRVPVESVEVQGLRAVTWDDSCLGLPEDGEACTDALTPGFLVELGDGFSYRADREGRVRREAGGPGVERPEPYPDTEIRLRYSVEGGIAGRPVTYETDSWQLSEQEEAELRRLVEAADFFSVRNVLPTSPVYDGIVVRLWIAVGRRAHEVVRGDGIDVGDTEELRALMAWAAARTPSRFPGTEL